MPETILVERDGRVATITVNRPDKLNALSQQVRDEVLAALAELEPDDSIGAVVVTGAGDKAFIAGADIAEFAGRGPMDQREAMRFPRLYDVMASFPKPVIASINGFCLGGGCELAMSCDVRIASEKARFGQPEIKLGLIPGGGGTQRLPRLVGQGRAMFLNLTGDFVDAETAYAWGLVEKVVPVAELEDAAVAIAGRIAAQSAHAVGVLRELARTTRDLPLEEGLRREAEGFVRCLRSEDGAEGVAAFVEKRAPSFVGR